MTSREQMIKKAAAALRSVGDFDPFGPRDWAAAEAKTVLDAILPQITTMAELEVLPEKAVLLTAYGFSGDTNRFINWSAEDFATIGPLTVVWTPEVAS